MNRPTIRDSWWRRLLRRPSSERAAWLEGGEWQHHDLLSSALVTPEARRAYRTDADMSAIYGAVFAAIRRRVRAVSVPRLVLLRKVGKEEVEVESHPALDALQRVNESLTFRQGMGLIEQHKLTMGKAYWIKRRNRLGVVMEFEIWQPEQVEIIPDPRKPWVPATFVRHTAIGRDETVAREDVIWFRHLVDPRNPLNGLSPISAIRVGLDTGLEAQRFNQRFFDNSTAIGQVFSAVDAGPAEIARLEKDIERKFRGADRAHRALVIGGEVKALETTVSHRDMEFLEQQKWQVEEVARAFEMAPEMIGAGGRTFENVEHAMRDFWQMIVDQVSNTLDEFNEFFVTPDFGPEFALAVRTDNISALQDDRKKRAEVDEIYLRTGVTYVNEVRARDGLDNVAWGAVPLLPNTIAPLGSAPPPAPAGPPRMRTNQWPASVIDAEADMADGWERRLARELRGIIAHLNKMAKRALDISDVGSYDWDWWDQYGDAVMREVSIAYSAALAATGFVETPLLGIQTLATRFAAARAGELLAESGRLSVSAVTREGVRDLVAQTIEEGQSLNWLQKQLRESYLFDRKRAETIARTETAHALGKASMQSFQSQGWEGKSWITARDDRVCTFCRTAEGDGVIPLAHHFSNGVMDTGDSHPRCLPAESLVHVASPILAATKRWYKGDLVTIITASGYNLSCTPNHPILTPQGWVAAGLLDVGSYIISRALSERPFAGNVYNQQMPARVEDIVRAFGRSQQVTARPVPITAEDFHGDGKGSQIAVIYANGLLRDGFDATFGEEQRQCRLCGRDMGQIALAGLGMSQESRQRWSQPSSGSMSGGNLMVAGFRGHARPFQQFGSVAITDRDIHISQPPDYRGAAYADPETQAIRRLAGEVQIDKIIWIGWRPFSGHVYNLQTRDEIYLAEGIITHNCRCKLEPSLELPRASLNGHKEPVRGNVL